MSFSVGEIGLDLVLESKGFQKQVGAIRTQADSASSKISSSFKKIGVAVAAAFSTKTIATFGKSCIDLGSDLAEVQNVVDVTFKKMSSNVNQWAKNASASYGLSETMAKKYVGTFGSMAEAFGFTEKQSYDMSTALTGLTGDVASFYNLTQDEAYTKLKAVFSGETESLKDLGVVMTQSALDGYAMANGYGKTVSAMSEAEKVTLRYNFVLNQLKNASGDFTRTQDSWANQTRVLQLRFDSLKATLGQGLINAFTPVIKVINSLIDRLSTVSEKFKALTEQIFGNAGGTSSTTSDISSAADSASALTDEAQNSSSALQNVADSAEKAKRSVAGFDKLNILSKNDTTSTTTSGATPTTSSTKPTSTTVMSGAVDKFASSWNSKGQKVLDSIKKSFNKIKDAVKTIGTSWSEVWNNGSGKKMLDNLKKLLSNCFDIIGNIAGAFTEAWNKGDTGNKVVQSIIDKWNSLIELINTVADDFKKVWNDGTGERIWGNILTIITNCNNTTKILRDKIKEAWDKNETGKKLWSDILGIVESITDFLSDMSQIRLEWLESLDLSPLVTAVEKLAEAFGKLLDACGDKLKTAYKNILLPLAKWTIEEAVPKLVDLLADALKGISDVIKKISPNVLNAIASGIGAVATAIIVFKTGVAIANGINKVKTAMNLLLLTLESHPLLVIASAIGGIVLAVQAYNALEWSSSEAKKFADEIETVKNSLETTTSGIEENLSGTMERLDGLYADNTLVDSYQKKLDELLGKATLTPEEQSQLQTIVTYFNNNVTGFDETWKKYVKVSDDGKVELKGDLKEIINSIDETIDKYQLLASTSALTELSTENSKEQISARKEMASSEKIYLDKRKQVEAEEKKLNDWLKKKGLSYSSFETIYNNGGTKNDALYTQGAEYFENIKSYKKDLSSLNSSYKDAVNEVNKLTMTGDDLSDVMGVLNGDYSDAAAVMMAYNEGMINLEDVQNSQWKTLDNLESKAKDTGKNTVIGLVDGSNELKNALVENSNGLATILLSEYDRTMDINSPSKEMYKRGVWTVEGLANGVSNTSDKVKSPLQKMIDKIKETIDPIKNVFANAFGGIWAVIKQPLNWLMEHLETFVNGFIGGINAVASGADWAVNTLGNIFGQNWHVGQLDKVTLPRFAKGAIVKAPTLAVVGDNAGANSGNPEVIAPLNKLKTMMNTSSGYDTEILNKMLATLNRIYEMFVIFRNNGGNMYEFVAKLNGSVLFDEMVRQNDLYKKRHNGNSAF